MAACVIPTALAERLNGRAPERERRVVAALSQNADIRTEPDRNPGL